MTWVFGNQSCDDVVIVTREVSETDTVLVGCFRRLEARHVYMSILILSGLGHTHLVIKSFIHNIMPPKKSKASNEKRLLQNRLAQRKFRMKKKEEREGKWKPTEYVPSA